MTNFVKIATKNGKNQKSIVFTECLYEGYIFVIHCYL